MNMSIRPDESKPMTFQFGMVPNDRFEHPSLDYTAFSLVAMGDSSLLIGLPFGQTITFDLRRFPLGTWVDLQDTSGRPIPLLMCVTSQGQVFGRWLSPSTSAPNVS